MTRYGTVKSILKYVFNQIYNSYQKSRKLGDPRVAPAAISAVHGL